MKTEFAKAIEAGEDVVRKVVVCINDAGWFGRFEEGEVLVVHGTMDRGIYFTNGTYAHTTTSEDFEFKHVLDNQKEENVEVKLLSEQNKLLEAMLEGAKARNKQYEQQIQMLKDDVFNLQMENARLELAAQRWEMFNCEANRNIADKLLKTLADEAVETYN